MHTFIKRALVGTLLAGGITLLGATVANAAETTGEDGLLSGDQALIDVSAPVTIVDNAVSVIGDSTAAPAPAAGHRTGRCTGRTAPRRPRRAGKTASRPASRRS